MPGSARDRIGARLSPTSAFARTYVRGSTSPRRRIAQAVCRAAGKTWSAVNGGGKTTGSQQARERGNALARCRAEALHRRRSTLREKAPQGRGIGVLFTETSTNRTSTVAQAVGDGSQRFGCSPSLAGKKTPPSLRGSSPKRTRRRETSGPSKSSKRIQGNLDTSGGAAGSNAPCSERPRASSRTYAARVHVVKKLMAEAGRTHLCVRPAESPARGHVVFVR